MSEELILLQEYFESLGLDKENLNANDLELLEHELRDAGELGLADWVRKLNGPHELLEYLEE